MQKVDCDCVTNQIKPSYLRQRSRIENLNAINLTKKKIGFFFPPEQLFQAKIRRIPLFNIIVYVC